MEKNGLCQGGDLEADGNRALVLCRDRKICRKDNTLLIYNFNNRVISWKSKPVQSLLNNIYRTVRAWFKKFCVMMTQNSLRGAPSSMSGKQQAPLIIWLISIRWWMVVAASCYGDASQQKRQRGCKERKMSMWIIWCIQPRWHFTKAQTEKPKYLWRNLNTAVHRHFPSILLELERSCEEEEPV